MARPTFNDLYENGVTLFANWRTWLLNTLSNLADYTEELMNTHTAVHAPSDAEANHPDTTMLGNATNSKYGLVKLDYYGDLPEIGGGNLTALPVEQVQDIAAAMATDGVQTRMSVGYSDLSGVLHFNAFEQTEENFTTVLKDKLDLIDEGAEVNETSSDVTTHGHNTEVSDAITGVKGAVEPEGDTLAKLHTLIQSINAILGSDDLDLDTVQELVDYIKANKDLIDSITTNKINISAIVNDLLTTAAGSVLDARQGKVLKDLHDTLQAEVNTNTAKETNIAHPLVETAVPVGAEFTDTVYDDTAIQAEVNTNTTHSGSAHAPSDAEKNDANTTLEGNAFNGNSQLVKTESDGKLPVLNASNLTNIPNEHTHTNKSDLDNITATDLANYDSAYSWGDHSAVGYYSSATANRSDIPWNAQTLSIGDIVVIDASGNFDGGSGVFKKDVGSIPLSFTRVGGTYGARFNYDSGGGKAIQVRGLGAEYHDAIWFGEDGIDAGVKLSYGGNTRMETTLAGAKTTGDLEITDTLIAPARPLSIKTADYTMASTDYTIFADATNNTVTITLESSPVHGRLCNIKCIDNTFTCDINPNGNNIDGSGTNHNLLDMESISLQYISGFGWAII